MTCFFSVCVSVHKTILLASEPPPVKIISEGEALIADVSEILNKALADAGKVVPEQNLALKITAQGGVGTAEEQDFLLDYYNIDSVGWGTPFLLVPEVTNVDKPTLKKLKEAKEKDLYLSDASPLGVPFNNIRNSSKFLDIKKGRLGSACPKKYLALNPSENGKTICTASRKYQEAKYEELKAQSDVLTEAQFKKQYKDLTAKECLCNGLSTSVMHINEMDRKLEKDGVSICPGPNLAYYSETVTLKDMTNHIYGKGSVIQRTDRPNMFIKELGLYVDFLQKKLDTSLDFMDKKQERYFGKFIKNMEEGIAYYQNLFAVKNKFSNKKEVILSNLLEYSDKLKNIKLTMQEALVS